MLIRKPKELIVNHTCKYIDEEQKEIIERAIEEIYNGNVNKPKAIWIEASGCFGEIISLLDGFSPDIEYMTEELLDIFYFGTIMSKDGEEAYESLIDIIDKEYILIVSGAIPTADLGVFARIATYNGKEITAVEIINRLAIRAKYILAIGTCASFGGITAARPNISEAKSVNSYLNKENIINIPGCPANPLWVLGTIAYIALRAELPVLDELKRPKAYFGELIHERCERRSYFNNGIFAKKLGDKECMFMLGCKGPITKGICPISRWNQSNNWPIGSNTPCIGCSGEGFPDENEPFITYGGGF